MRYLLLTRGLPLCGKTTWIRQNNLTNHAIDAKALNKLLQSPKLSIDGRSYGYQPRHKLGFSLLHQILEERLANGDFIVVEDLHISKSYFSNYQELARAYAYRILVVDFSGVSLDEILRRYKKQEASAVASPYTEKDLVQLHKDLMESEVPINCNSMRPSDISTLLRTNQLNLSAYKTIHHIGDVQGCFWVLEKYLGELQEDSFYIFLGDYMDRGVQNYEVLSFLLSIMDKKNVCLLEGNHERWLWQWANNQEVSSREFRLNTQRELESRGLAKADAKRLYRSLRPYLYYRFHDKRVLCTHGGLSSLPESMKLLSASQCIYGVGNYTDTLAITKAFGANTDKQTYQVFGHRNREKLAVSVAPRNYLLEGKVEFGGYLRVLQLDKNGFHDASIPNTVFVSSQQREERELLQKSFDSLQRDDFVSKLAYSPYLAYDFSLKRSRELSRLPLAFSPFVIDTQKWELVARGLELNKCFRHSHVLESTSDLAYPLEVYAVRWGQPHALSFSNENLLFLRLGEGLWVSEELPNGLDLTRILDSMPTAQAGLESKSLCLNLYKHDSSWTLASAFANSLQTREVSAGLLDSLAKQLGTNSPLKLASLENPPSLREFLRILNNTIDHRDTSYLDDLSGVIVEGNFGRLDSGVRASNLNLDSVMLDNLAFYSRLLRRFPFLSWRLFARDGLGNYYELDSPMQQEMRILERVFRIWLIQQGASSLQWINTPFRKIFYEWFMTFWSKNEHRDFITIWNLFLAFVAQSAE